jgi:hypothetical protein
MAIEMRELWTTDVVVMKDRLGRPGNDSQTVALEHRLGQVAAVREETRRAGLDRPFAYRSGF